MTAWWERAAVYQIYVRSFADSGANGIGDLGGIIEHLDHVSSLGVDAVWLTPFFPSPQRDHGYDVSDYFGVEPAYGSMADIDALIEACHGRGLRVLADIVPNHCSSDHVWFQAALDAAPRSAERARFYFRDGRGADGSEPPNNWQAMFGGSAWTRVPDGQWYLHSFTPWQPDFDWDNEDVAAMFDTVLRFWFDRGIDGFRVDAVTHLGKAPGLPDAPSVEGGPTANPYALYWPSAHVVWRRWRAVVDRYERDHPGRVLVTVAEAYTPGRMDVLLDYVRPDEFNQAFSFDLLLSPWNAATIRTAIDDTYEAFTSAGAAMTWTLNNHDTQRTVTRYGRRDATDPTSWTGSNLVYSDSTVDVVLGTTRARAAIVMLAALPGALYLYQGEELGLPEVLDLDRSVRADPLFARTDGRQIGRDGCRVPLPWSIDPAAGHGFSARPADPWLPQPADWGTLSVEHQNGDDDSILTLYRRLLARRRDLPDDPNMRWEFTGIDGIVAFSRAGMLVVLNPTSEPIALPGIAATNANIMVSSCPGHSDPRVVPSGTCVWIRRSLRARSEPT